MFNRKNTRLASWPLVNPKDDGIRPAGKPDECFYCNRKVGEPHGRDCVMVDRKIRARYTIEVITDDTHRNTDEDTVVWHNHLWEDVNVPFREDEIVGLLCELAETVNDTPRRKLRPLLCAYGKKPKLN